MLDKRLRDDLKGYLKARDRRSASVLRSVLSAIDNATAVAVEPGYNPTYDFSGEATRREVNAAEMLDILKSQLREREEAITVFDSVGETGRANELRDEIALLEPYLRIAEP